MKMFLLGFLLGSFVGGAITFAIYACVLVGKEADEGKKR